MADHGGEVAGIFVGAEFLHSETHFAAPVGILPSRARKVLLKDFFGDVFLVDGQKLRWCDRQEPDSGVVKFARPTRIIGHCVRHAGGQQALREEAMEKLEWIADTYLSVGAPVQCAAPRLLQLGEEIQRQIRVRTAENLRFARTALQGTAANVLDVEAGWYATLRMPRVRTEEEYALDLLERHDVLVQPGYFYDFESEAFLIVSLLTETAQFREGIARIKTLV